MTESKTEEQLYEPIKGYLQKQFAQFGKCELEITKAKIPEKVKRWLDDPALLFIRVEKKLPDIMGHFKPDSSKKQPYSFLEGLIVVEVKNEPLTIQDIIQAKVYAEAFNAPFAFLISSESMIEEIHRFLSKRYLILSFGAYRKVYIGKFNVTKVCVDEEDWYPEDPFKPS